LKWYYIALAFQLLFKCLSFSFKLLPLQNIYIHNFISDLEFVIASYYHFLKLCALNMLSNVLSHL
jgi:hypothetical protein